MNPGITSPVEAATTTSHAGVLVPTSNKKQKRAARDRQAATGQPYTQALQGVQPGLAQLKILAAERPVARPARQAQLLAQRLRPGHRRLTRHLRTPRFGQLLQAARKARAGLLLSLRTHIHVTDRQLATCAKACIQQGTRLALTCPTRQKRTA